MDTLAAFITRELQPIMADWELFARSLSPEISSLSSDRLRDHAEQILKAVAVDIAGAQSKLDQAAKSKGQSPDTSPPLTAAAEQHAVSRMNDQFNLNELVAEFRALRASVLRRWAGTSPTGGGRVEEVTRFNEAIDQALAASMGHYHAKLEEARTVILGVLAHDLRNPLNAVSLSAQFILRQDGIPPLCIKAATRTLNGVTRMKGLVQDLLDFTSTRLGGGLPVHCQAADLRLVVRDVVEETQASHPGRVISCTMRGACQGEWDESRVAQLLTNLLTNALQHGAESKPVSLLMEEKSDGVAIQIANEGNPIPPTARATLFQPLTGRQVQSAAVPQSSGSSGLGLGLYIASEIAAAHHGRVQLLSSDEAGTVFEVFLPKRPASE